VRLTGQPYDELVIGTDDAASVAGEVTAALSQAS
jgi:hypothetical protein